ncbi:DUF2079 domain-containing protein [Kitasatospora arboriphila]
MGFAAARSGLVWAAAVPFAARAANADHAYWGTGFHYNLLIEVVLFGALTDALRRRRSSRPPVWSLVAATAAAALLHGPAAAAVSRSSCHRCTAARTAVRLVPNGATVAADTYLLPHLVDRTTAYLLTPAFTDSA